MLWFHRDLCFYRDWECCIFETISTRIRILKDDRIIPIYSTLLDFDERSTNRNATINVYNQYRARTIPTDTREIRTNFELKTKKI